MTNIRTNQELGDFFHTQGIATVKEEVDSYKVAGCDVLKDGIVYDTTTCLVKLKLLKGAVLVSSGRGHMRTDKARVVGVEPCKKEYEGGQVSVAYSYYNPLFAYLPGSHVEPTYPIDLDVEKTRTSGIHIFPDISRARNYFG